MQEDEQTRRSHGLNRRGDHRHQRGDRRGQGDDSDHRRLDSLRIDDGQVNPIPDIRRRFARLRNGERAARHPAPRRKERRVVWSRRSSRNSCARAATIRNTFPTCRATNATGCSPTHAGMRRPDSRKSIVAPITFTRCTAPAPAILSQRVDRRALTRAAAASAARASRRPAR